MKPLSRAEALQELFRVWNYKRQTEIVPLEKALGRICAENVYSRLTLPVYRSSARDGIAVRAADFAGELPDTQKWKPGVNYIRADTGDDFDDAFDAVIQIEDVAFTDDGGFTLLPGIKIQQGMNIIQRGASVAKDELIFERGLPVRACDMGTLALGGITEIQAVKKPVVAFIPTGNELIAAGCLPSRGQHIDANSVMVKNMLIEMGAEPRMFPIQKDDPDAVKVCLLDALETSDIVIVNGGSSKGTEDYNARALAQIGTMVCAGVRAAPGKPLHLAVLQDKAVVNLPGPMLAAYFGMDWCVRGIVCHALGIPVPQRPRVKAVLTKDLFPNGAFADTGFELLSRLSLSRAGNGYEAWPVPFFDRYDGKRTPGFHNAQCAVQCSKGYAQGDEIEAELLYGYEYIENN